MANRDLAIRFQLLYGDEATAAVETQPQQTLAIGAEDYLWIAKQAPLGAVPWAKFVCEQALARGPEIPKVEPRRPTSRLDQHSTLEQVYGCLASWALPPYVAPGLHLYLHRGICTGDFLLELLQGNIRAVLFADDDNTASFHRWVRMLTVSIPAAAWGSKEKVSQWANDRQAEAEERGRL